MSVSHCDPSGSLDIHNDVQSGTTIGIHWGTFPLADEAHYMPAAELLDEIGKRANGGGPPEEAVQFVVVGLGESILSGEASVKVCREKFGKLLDEARENIGKFEADMTENYF